MEGKKSSESGEKPKIKAPKLRADAKRNLDSLLEAAKAVFAESGVDAPVRSIAARAGVGVGTVYRHFPKRSDLIIGVFKREVDICAETAHTFASEHKPDVALTLWLRQYTAFIVTKRGLASALHSGTPACEALPDYFSKQLVPSLRSLLDAAIEAKQIGSDIDAYELLVAVANLSVSAGEKGSTRSHRMIDLLIDGLRFGASKQQGPTKDD